MSFCGSCGAGIPDSAGFCGQCGRAKDEKFVEQKPVSFSADTAPITTVVPIIASSPRSVASYTAPAYTAPTYSPAYTPQPETVQAAPAAPRGGANPMVGLALLGLLAVAGGVYLVTKSDGSSKAGAASTIAGDPGAATTASSTIFVDPEVAATEQLQQFVAQDRPTADTLVGSWIPQLTAKRVGLKADGITYGPIDIVDDHTPLRTAYGAILVDAGAFQFTTNGGPMTGWFLTIVPEKFDNKADAVQWCTDHGLASNNCLARQFKPPTA